MKNNTRKILLAVLVVMTLLVSMATITASAADDSTVYLNPGNDWVGGEARFAIYTWGGPAGEQWIDMTDANSDGIYEGVVPAGYSNIIFCRMNPAYTENMWNNDTTYDRVWNQTVDLTLYAGGTFTITDPWGTGDGKGSNGSWEGGEIVEGTTPPVIVGPGVSDVEGLELAVGDYYLCGWLNDGAYGIEGDSSNLGTNKFVNGKLTVTFNTQSYVVIKDAQNNSYWTQAYITENIGTFYNSTTGAGEKMMVPAGRVDFTLYKGENDTFVLTYESAGHTGGTEGNPENAPVWEDYELITIYLGNSKEWFTPRAHIWYRDENGLDYAWTTWEEDIEFEIDENFYYYIEIPSICNYIIFRENNGEQTDDLQIPAGETNLYINGTGTWVKKDSFKPSAPPSDIESPVTLVVKNDAGWDQVYIYYWSINGSASVNWPGIEMEQGEDGLYYYTIPEGNFFVIFNNGIMDDTDPAFRKTADMKIPKDSKVLYNNIVLNNADGGDDQNWEHFVVEEKPDDNPGNNNDNNGGNNNDTPNDDNNNTPENPEQPKEMTLIQKLALKLLLLLRSLEETFKNLLGGFIKF